MFTHLMRGMASMRAGFSTCFLIVLLLVPHIAVVAAQPEVTVSVVYASREAPREIPLSLLDIPAQDNGLKGAELGLNDNQTTGDFLGHRYDLSVALAGADEAIVDVVSSHLESGVGLIVADLEADDLLLLADAYPDALLVNVRASDDRLRNDDCRANVFHIAPSRAMLADALVQYLSWKRWSDLVLVTGRHPQDELFALSLTRSVERFGLKWVDTKRWTSVPGARRTDSGHHSLQQEVPVFSRFRDHDVVVVADEADEFGEYFSYRTSEPRPVVGTQGLIPSAWHRTQEQWGATQIQRRFIKLANRYMTPRDYGAWAAMRSLGEAVTQTGKVDVPTVREYMLSDRFNLAGFKGVPLTFRTWNGQLRQPVLIVGPRMLVSVSPQEGFLHQVSELDTLGFDQPESSCAEFTQ